jgi:hypothetical protein
MGLAKKYSSEISISLLLNTYSAELCLAKHYDMKRCGGVEV